MGTKSRIIKEHWEIQRLYHESQEPWQTCHGPFVTETGAVIARDRMAAHLYPTEFRVVKVTTEVVG